MLTHDYAEKVCNDNRATLAIVTDDDVLTFLRNEVMDTNQYAFLSSWERKNVLFYTEIYTFYLR